MDHPGDRRRFDDYCRRKTDAAANARIEGFETVRAPGVGARDLAAIGNEWTREKFDGWFYGSVPDGAAALPAVSLVFVQSADGNTVAEDPATLGGGDTDRHLIYEGLSRVDADAVMAGANTAAGDDLMFSVWHPELVRLRTERGHPRHPAQVILTERGDLPVHRALLYNEPSLSAIIVTTTPGAVVLARRIEGRPWIEVIDAGHPIDLAVAMRALRARGLAVISAIGGRRTAGALLSAGLVSDLYLTTSPRSGGEPKTPLWEGPLPEHIHVLEKRGRGAGRGVRFEHLSFASGDSSRRGRL